MWKHAVELFQRRCVGFIYLTKDAWASFIFAWASSKEDAWASLRGFIERGLHYEASSNVGFITRLQRIILLKDRVAWASLLFMKHVLGIILLRGR